MRSPAVDGRRGAGGFRPYVFPVVTAVVAVSFAGGLVAFVREDEDVLAHGVEVTATVEEVAHHYRTADSCLMSFGLNGIEYEQWSSSMGGCETGEVIPAVLDPADHETLRSGPAGHRWILYALLVAAAGYFGWLAVGLFRQIRAPR